MKETIELHLKAVDFKGTNFMSNRNCAISKALRRQLLKTDVGAGTWSVKIEDRRYLIGDGYQSTLFDSDKADATSVGFDNTTIRTITLTKAN